MHSQWVFLSTFLATQHDHPVLTIQSLLGMGGEGGGWKGQLVRRANKSNGVNIGGKVDDRKLHLAQQNMK
jgi:hypothetical protein